jgi:hypothetical protein
VVVDARPKHVFSPCSLLCLVHANQIVSDVVDLPMGQLSATGRSATTLVLPAQGYICFAQGELSN